MTGPAGSSRWRPARSSAWQSEAVAPATGRGVHRLAHASRRPTTLAAASCRETLREGAAGTIRSVTQYSYDALGRLDCTAVRMNPADVRLAARPRPARRARASGPDRITRNVYDAAGQRLQVREGVGTAVEAAEATWTYNLNGQITTVIDGNGNRAELRYDGHGRQDRWTFPSTTRRGRL